jgi:inner membrane protein
LILDFLNQYGIHPFWPFYNGWFFADMMFIVEPWLWLTLIPFLFFSRSHRYFRLLLGSLLVAGLSLEWFTGFVPKAIATGMTLWSLLLIWGFRVWNKKTQVVVCYSSLGLIGLLFSLESFWLKREITNIFIREQPEVTVNDVILSPFPSNPICWQVVTVETSKDGETFSLRKGVVSIFTDLYQPRECLELISKEVKISQTHPQVIWTTQLKLVRRELIKLYQTNCFVAAQLRFVRAPFWYRRDGKLYFADLRFETETRGNFSKLEIPETAVECPKLIPPWTEPRRDLLSH